MRPIMFGYQTVHADAPRFAQMRGRRILTDYARREGFSLGTIYVVRDPRRPSGQLASLVSAARRLDVSVVAAPRLTDLGEDWRSQSQTLRALQHAGLRVLVAVRGGP